MNSLSSNASSCQIKMVQISWILIFSFCVCHALAAWQPLGAHNPDEEDDRWMHPDHESGTERVTYSNDELDAAYWVQQGKDRVMRLSKAPLNLNRAKNVIMFLGDGMSIPTLAAARIYMGQLEGKSGEESELSFEKFPTAGLSKTYCVDRQVADSACSATAYLCGVKANYNTIGVSARVPRSSCEMQQNTSYHVHSLARNFLDSGRSAGVVTTTRVTHASPAGTYAHTAHRSWETDADVKSAGHNTNRCPDIAQQLIHGETGSQFKVILGGGRREFRNTTVTDEEGTRGRRSDGRDLIQEWRQLKTQQGQSNEYVWNRNQLMNVSSSTNYLLGLFEGDHCRYNLERNTQTEPSFEEMVETAIKMLSRDSNGYFLFAEGGRIDHGHHGTYARLALDETVEFSKAIAKAVSMTNANDTLIVVTADHAHVMTMSGYPSRGNEILNANDRGTASDGLPYLTLGYENGPGYRREVNGNRVDVTQENMSNVRFRYPSKVPLSSETHGGDDVAVFAYGPWNHLFTGTFEQSYIAQSIKYASCVDDDFSACAN